MPLLLLLLPFALAELATVILVGGAIGVLPTILLFIALGVLGLALLRSQGLRALQDAQAALARGEAPVGPVADGAVLVVAGMLLVLPGLLSDGAALLLLVPGVRRWIIGRIARRVRAGGQWGLRRGRPQPGRAGPGDVIEGEFSEIHPAADPALPPIGESRWRRPGDPPRN